MSPDDQSPAEDFGHDATGGESRDRPDGGGDDSTPDVGPTDGPSGREVVVPARLYKTVTVMSALLAMVAVVVGFVALDAATNRARASPAEVDPLVALLGLGLIVGGAVVYAFGTRFRAAGMAGGDSTELDSEAEAEAEPEPELESTRTGEDG